MWRRLCARPAAERAMLAGTRLAAACSLSSRDEHWSFPMRQIPIAAAAALAIMTVAASAQTTTAPRTTTPSPSATQMPAPKPAINPLTKEAVSGIEGTAIYGTDNDKLGHVSEVLMDPLTRKIDRLVVTSGVGLGVGGHPAAIPVCQFYLDPRKRAF